MKRLSIPSCFAAALLSSVLSPSAQAQAILTGKDLTERNVIEALSPSHEDIKVRTRSIRVEREQPAEKAAHSEGAKVPSASLLITFQTNSAQLTPQARSSLDVVGRALQTERLADFNFAVEGHADPRGRPGYNLQLSQARAASVVEYLATHHSIVRDRLRAIGKGDTELMNPEQPAAPENRRVTFITLRE